MKTPNDTKQNVKEKERQIATEQKVTSCCGPTCCSGSSHKTNSERKEK
jgi:hypothetical protein